MRIPTRLRESLFLTGAAVGETRQMERKEEGGVLRSFCNRYPIVPACRFSALSSSMTTSCERPAPSWLAPNITRSGGDGDQQLRWPALAETARVAPLSGPHQTPEPTSQAGND